jgi:ABC-type Co2+ transport system permease subunit
MLFLIFLIISGVLALLEYARRRVTRLKAVIQYTNLGHIALATLAANAVTEGAAGIAVSAILTALYVVYQLFQDRSPNDIAVYTGAYAVVVASKLGLGALLHI